MENNIFLASYDDGVTRAVRGDEGQWIVEHLIKDLKVTCLASDPADLF